MARNRGDITQQNSFEADYAGPLAEKERSLTLQDAFDLTFKYEGMKTRVAYDAANPTQTGRWIELKAQSLCDLGLGAWGTVFQHWNPLGGTQKVLPYANNTFYEAGTIIYHYRFTFATDADFTSGASHTETWKEARSNGNGFFISRIPYHQGKYNYGSDINTVTPIVHDLASNNAIQELFLETGAFAVTFNVRQDRNFTYMPFKLRIRVAAGMRLVSVDFPSANGFAGPMPSVTDKTYATETVLEWEFFAREINNGPVLWYYVPIERTGDTYVTGTDPEAYLKALPGYTDPTKNALMKDASGAIFWGVGGASEPPTGTDLGPQICNFSAETVSPTEVLLTWDDCGGTAPDYGPNIATFTATAQSPTEVLTSWIN